MGSLHNDLSFSTGNVQDSKIKVYEVLDIGQNILEGILSGKIRRLDKLQEEIKIQNKNDEQVYYNSNQPYKSSSKYMLFYKSKYDERISDNIFVIETIFIK